MADFAVTFLWPAPPPGALGPSLLGRVFREFAWFGFREQQPEHDDTAPRDGAKGEETGGVPEVLHQISRPGHADRGADPDRGARRTLREVIATGTARQVGDDER